MWYNDNTKNNFMIICFFDVIVHEKNIKENLIIDMKKIIKTIGDWIEINLILIFPHIFAFIGLAFNDTGVHYDNFFNAIPYMGNGLLLLMITSILMGIYYHKKKENHNSIVYAILQSIVIILWIAYYTDNLVG